MTVHGMQLPYSFTFDGPEVHLRGSRYEIDLDAIRHNYRQLRAHLADTVRVYACLKRNAYGCGAGPVASALAEEGIDGFAVASILDALSIRRAGVSGPVLLYPGALPVCASEVKAQDLTVTISSTEELRQWHAAIENLRVFLKIDLGFMRAGATPLQAIELLRDIRNDRNVRIEGLYAHLSELPGSDDNDARKQFDKMNELVRQAQLIDLDIPIVMMSSTDGVLNFPEMDFDAVDPGALFVGLSDVGRPVRNVSLRPALTTISTSLVSVKRLDGSLDMPSGMPWIDQDMTLGVIGMGWGDGLPRHLSHQATALVRGKRAKLLAPSHLEHIRIDLSEIPEARFGDEVVLLGRQGDEHIDLDELAMSWGTDVIGIYAGLRDHIPRAYI